MSQELEFEARIMLRKEEYETLKEKYASFEEKLQTNYYFDTENKELKNKNTILRLRIVENTKNELTIKTKSVNFAKEINEKISYLEVILLLEKAIIENQNVLNSISKKISNVNTLKLIGKLSTKRIFVHCNEFDLFLDKNYYEGRVDYDLEIESDSKENAEKYLNMFIEKYHLKKGDKYIPKSGRLFKAINY